MVERWLLAKGLSAARARIEARLFVDTMLGLQFDLVLTGAERDTSEAFEAAFRRLLELVA